MLKPAVVVVCLFALWGCRDGPLPGAVTSPDPLPTEDDLSLADKEALYELVSDPILSKSFEAFVDRGTAVRLNEGFVNLGDQATRLQFDVFRNSFVDLAMDPVWSAELSTLDPEDAIGLTIIGLTLNGIEGILNQDVLPGDDQ
jgi:hypothetical protein